ncbi:DUF4843 domain-containing protein [Pedobacter sp. MC2016-14]|uniref:DUF4843 domain-containing protein n=1 Tax=Pedobacter sp. MC2016-14 TaxID=2897327 RepID=UPI001E650140|nr:DUF4843 domain-containing protein [Pedobacter sp. MC2016-14]MCD0490665.1 DUF4843 domain-containing protein [Pedobacter sp. MC2016-14]
MKIYNILTVALFGITLVMGSCKKEIIAYVDDPRLYFYEEEATAAKSIITSRSFSFAGQPGTVTQQIIPVQVKIMGENSNKDRSFSAEAVPGLTNATQGTDYRILGGTIAANKNTGTLNVIVYRIPGLDKITKTLVLKISNSGDFKPATLENSIFTINWNEALIKPANWDTFPGLASYFGVYSMVKWKFIIETLGITSFPLVAPVPGASFYSNAAMLDFKAQLKAALIIRNLSPNTPLTDEFNLAVSFP